MTKLNFLVLNMHHITHPATVWREFAIYGVIFSPQMFHVDIAFWLNAYRQVSNKTRNLVGNKIVDHSDVVGAAPVGAASTTSSFST